MTSPNLGQPPKAKKQKREKPVLESLPNEGHPGFSKFARALGSTDYQTREKGLHALKSWLLRKTDLQESDMMKVWKGLFYCFWHSDKAPVQAELAERLAAMLTQLPEQSAFLYFAAFTATLRREWFGIDRLRMDKFLLLIRKFIHYMLACLKIAKWRADLLQRYSDFLHHNLVIPSDTLPAAGVAYHCADVLLDELRAVADGKPVPGPAVAALLEPFTSALQTGEQVVLQRIGDGLFDTLLSELATPTDDSPYLQKLDAAALSARLFELGAAPSTRARNRQVLYDLSSALEKLQRKRQRVDDGAQAGPSVGNPASGKLTKKQLKAAKATAGAAAGAATAAAVELAAPNGDVGPSRPEAPGGAGARLKRKAKASDVTAADEEPASVGAQEHAEAKGDAARRKLLKKRQQQQQQQPNGAGETEPEPLGESLPGSAAKVGNGAGARHREPTSGQKAALRATVAKAKARVAAVAAAAAATPKAATEKKGLEEPQAQRAGGEAAGAATPATDGKPSALGKRSAPGSSLKAQKQQKADDEAAAATTPAQANGRGKAGARANAVTTAKKGRVVINLQKNLYFAHGGPIPDPDVRTPPPARAKGGILKKTATSCPPKVAQSNGTATSAKQPRQPASAKQATRVVPKQARRASAALFF